MYANTARDVGRVLRDRRRSLHLTQAELAERAGVSRPTLVRVEGGHDRVELAVVLRLLAAAGLGADLSPLPASDVDLDAILARTSRASR